MTDTLFGSGVRRTILVSIIIVFSIGVLFQLFKMQILSKSVYEEKSNDNSIKGLVLKAPRGILFDRDYNYLVGNKPSYSVSITPSNYNIQNNSLIEKVLGIEQGGLDKIFIKNSRFSQYVPRRIQRSVDFKFIAWLEEHKENLSGVDYNVEMQRDYSFGIHGSHMFGYTNEISPAMLNKNKEIYSLGDYVGNNGIEKTYEKLLRGTKGKEYFVMDSKQMIIGRYEDGQYDVQPGKGNDLILTIDSEAQRMAEKLFEGKKGALVAIEPETGDILAFVSAPSYDLSKFGSLTSGEVWNELKQDTLQPLFNRATMSRNPPGSTYKMVTALAALENGIITTSDFITCRGSFWFGDRSFKCTHVHGKVNVISAIEKSCNVFFYQLILKVGLEKFAEYGRKFGFGSKSNLDIDDESVGIVPDSDYFDRAYGKGKWTRGYLISLAIGQGDLITTPVQMAQYCALLANYGKTKRPHFLKGWIDSETNKFNEVEYEEIDAGLNAEYLDLVRDAMLKVVHGKGTAQFIRQKEYTTAGKTGTAQNPHGEDHAIFIGFAPFDNPKIAVAVIVENVGFGSTHAAPIVRDVIKSYLNDSNSNPIATVSSDTGN